MTTDALDYTTLAWDDPRWDPPPRRVSWWQRRRHHRGVALVATTAGLAAAIAGAAVAYHRHHARPGGVPALVAQRPKLPGCGHYHAWWTMTLPPPGYRPAAGVLAANRCLLSSFADGRPAELTVDNGPDDIGHTGRTFYRVVGLRHLDIIWEDIPPNGPIAAAELADCAALNDYDGRIAAADCSPAGPVYR